VDIGTGIIQCLPLEENVLSYPLSAVTYLV
jgi:hypothetical protein